MAYIGQEPGQGQAERFIFTASGGETTVTADDDGLSIGYTENQVSVYLNGVKLVVGTDCIATNGSTITGLSALSASDVVEVIALSAFSPADTVPATGGTFTGNVIMQHLFPSADNASDLGSAAKRWRNIYTGDLHLANDRGNWTVIEEENYLTLRNNKTDKVYKLVMEEIV